MTEISRHNKDIIDQFTKQAAPFVKKFGDARSELLRLCLEAAAPTPEDIALDIACGPGITTCAIAKTARKVTGIDLTPAMIEQAKSRAEAEKLGNVNWQVGDVTALPFKSVGFSLTFTRFSFHHFENPLAVLREMARVTKTGGRVVVIDVYAKTKQHQANYDALEKLRDSSHVSGLQIDEFRGLFAQAGLKITAENTFRLPMELEAQLKSSFPSDADAIRRGLAADIGKNETGFEAHMEGNEIHFSHPIIMFSAVKA